MVFLSKSLSIKRRISQPILVAICVMTGLAACQKQGNTSSTSSALADISPGRYMIQSVMNNKCLDVPEMRKENGLQLQTWDCHNVDEQIFEVTRVDYESYRIVNIGSGKALDVPNGSHADGVAIQQWDLFDNANQRFLIIGSGEGYGIKSQVSNKVLDITEKNAENGARIQQWTDYHTPNQRWKLIPVGRVDSPITPTPDGGGNTAGLQWRKANLTYFESYPEEGTEECLEFNGCTWEGMFKALNDKQSLEWVKSNNILAVHSRDFEKYKLKTFRLRQGSRSIDAKVYDMCLDTDCDGCCTENAREQGFLIDIEKFSSERFGSTSGEVEWACLDCE